MPERRFSVRLLVDSLARFGRNDQLVLSLLAIVIGAAAGGAAIAFRHSIDLVQWSFYGWRDGEIAALASELPWWHVLLAPALGGLAIGLFIYFLMPGRRPEGVAQVIEANALQGGRMSLTTGIKAALVSAASIGVDEQHAAIAGDLGRILDLELIVQVHHDSRQIQSTDRANEFRAQAVISPSWVAPSEDQHLGVRLQGLASWSMTSPSASNTVTSKGIWPRAWVAQERHGS